MSSSSSPYKNHWYRPSTSPPPSPSVQVSFFEEQPHTPPNPRIPIQATPPQLIRRVRPINFSIPNPPRHQETPEETFENIPLDMIPSRDDSLISQAGTTLRDSPSPSLSPPSVPLPLERLPREQNHSHRGHVKFALPSMPKRAGRPRSYPIPPPPTHAPPALTNTYTPPSPSTNPAEIHRIQTIRNGSAKRQTVWESMRWFWQKHSWKIKGFVTGCVIGLLCVGVGEFMKLWIEGARKVQDAIRDGREKGE